MIVNQLRLTGLALILLASAASVAKAQDLSARQMSFSNFGAFQDYRRGHNISVLERERPEYEAPGIAVGGFTLFPDLTSSVGYTDNVLASPSNEKSDGYVSLAPTAQLQSNWSRNAATLSAGGRVRRYFDSSSENQTSWFVRGTGKFDISNSGSVDGGLATEKYYEERASVSSPAAAAEPVQLHADSAFVRGVYQQGRVRASLTGDFRKLDFKDVPQIGGGVINQDDRDRKNNAVTARGEVALTPDVGIFGLTSYTRTKYSAPQSAATDRDSRETQVMAGADFDVTALLRGEVGIGHVSRDYEGSLFPKAKGLALRAQVEYLPTPITSFTVNLDRRVEDSAFIGASGYFANIGTVRVDHELLRNLLLRGSVGFEKDNYQIDRSDKIKNASVGATYLVSPVVGLRGDLSYANRKSSGALAGRNFDAVTLLFSLVLQR